ncbi:hypothetical protein EGW08_008838 [Elysia chlorotica]|uniref:Uncharacterized protein n=1 Tax=Elysia chlorotica TaxID=188477 RepID=A0A433TPC6_ELYCH|nr:hypothetical protein EGW08_008838 [Elysia chlorotica]
MCVCGPGSSTVTTAGLSVADVSDPEEAGGAAAGGARTRRGLQRGGFQASRRSQVWREDQGGQLGMSDHVGCGVRIHLKDKQHAGLFVSQRDVTPINNDSTTDYTRFGGPHNGTH